MNILKDFPDYKLVSGFFNSIECEELNHIFEDIKLNAYAIMQDLKETGYTIDEYYKKNNNLIIVPEKNNSKIICRMEYLSGSSEEFNEKITLPIKRYLESEFGEELCLFKDKCNVKSPHGGAFPPHQDAPAYISFGPTIFITAGILLDDMTLDNGCLHMSTNYKSLKVGVEKLCSTPLGEFPLFNIYRGGERNGDIINSVQDSLNWEPIEANVGDVLIFNSFIPHFSNVNLSEKGRRIFYLTFNLAKEGDFYISYYNKKWQDYSNPQFHISTPTNHNKNSMMS